MTAGPLHYFYRLDHGAAVPAARPLDPAYRLELWRPADGGLMPEGVRGWVFPVWWAMHTFHLFQNRDYAQLVVYRGADLVHRSGVYPGYARFPFMAPRDLQIGDTWTAPEARGRGFAQAAISRIVTHLGRPGRMFWYLCEAGNAPSIAVIERMGFRRVGEGAKQPRLGLLALGGYVMCTDLTTPGGGSV